MKIGTKSVLFGAHQFLLHPLFVAVAWWRLYGFPWDPRLWVAFFVHDLGYWGKPNMDGPEGEEHPWLGARIMGRLFDTPRSKDFQCPNPWCDGGWSTDENGNDDGECGICLRLNLAAIRWHNFALFHSRFLAKQHGQPFSRLCVADKLACAFEPDWLYLPRVILTGEIHEYMGAAARKEGGKYSTMCEIGHGVRQWRRSIKTYLTNWAWEHRDGRDDTWTPAPVKSEAE